MNTKISIMTHEKESISDLLSKLIKEAQLLSDDKCRKHFNSSRKFSSDNVCEWIEPYLKENIRRTLNIAPKKKVSKLASYIISMIFGSKKEFDLKFKEHCSLLTMYMPFLPQDQLRGCALENFGLPTRCAALNKTLLIEKYVLNEVTFPDYGMKEPDQVSLVWNDDVPTFGREERSRKRGQRIKNQKSKNLSSTSSRKKNDRDVDFNRNIVTGSVKKTVNTAKSPVLLKNSAKAVTNSRSDRKLDEIQYSEESSQDIEIREIVKNIKNNTVQEKYLEKEKHSDGTSSKKIWLSNANIDEPGEDSDGSSDSSTELSTTKNVENIETEVLSDQVNLAAAKKRCLTLDQSIAKKRKYLEAEKENVPPELMTVFLAGLESNDENPQDEDEDFTIQHAFHNQIGSSMQILSKDDESEIGSDNSILQNNTEEREQQKNVTRSLLVSVEAQISIDERSSAGLAILKCKAQESIQTAPSDSQELLSSGEKRQQKYCMNRCDIHGHKEDSEGPAEENINSRARFHTLSNMKHRDLGNNRLGETRFGEETSNGSEKDFRSEDELVVKTRKKEKGSLSPQETVDALDKFLGDLMVETDPALCQLQDQIIH